VGEIRIRFLIIFPVKAALDLVGEGKGLFSELTGFQKAWFPWS
jgi:hypothetical protein